MGLHNLESEGLAELLEDMTDGVEKAQAFGWVDELLDAYANLPEVPGGNQVQALGYLVSGIRGLLFKRASKAYVRKADKLLKAIEANQSNRLAVFLEFVDQPGFDETTARYTVWKGTLFVTAVDGNKVVLWHPDKDFKPKDYSRILHTGYSEKGRRRRRRETR